MRHNHCKTTVVQPLWVGGKESPADLREIVTGATMLVTAHMHDSFSGATKVTFETTEDLAGEPDTAKWKPLNCKSICDPDPATPLEFVLDSAVEPFVSFGAKNTATIGVCICCTGEGQAWIRAVPDAGGADITLSLTGTSPISV